MMAAALLHKGLTVLTNVPRIQDTACMMKILAGELLLSRRLSDRSKAHRSPSYGVK